MRKLFLITIIIFTLNSCKEEVNFMDEFYNRNKDNSELCIFKNQLIYTVREITELYMKISSDSLVTQRIVFRKNKKTKNYDIINEDFSIDTLVRRTNMNKKEIINHIFKIFNLYRNLNVNSIWGHYSKNYIEFEKEEVGIMVYICEGDTLSEESKKEIEEKRKMAIKIYDDNWFYY